MQRLLFVSLSNIGDAVLTTPALQALHAAYPEARIDLVCDARSAQLFDYCPFRGDVFIKDKSAGLRGVFRLVRALRRRRYLVAVDLRTDGLIYALRARRRLVKRRGVDNANTLHAAEQHFAVVRPVLDDGRIPWAKVWIDPAVAGAVDERLRQLPRGRWLALGPGANWPGKVWAAERYVQTVRLLAHRLQGTVIVGGPEDVALGGRLAAAMPVPALDLCGRTDLLQAAAALARCTAFLGNDSGLGHLAAAVGTPTLTVFGPGNPARYRPWAAHGEVLVGEHGDIDRLEPAAVAQRLGAMLDAGRAAPAV